MNDLRGSIERLGKEGTKGFRNIGMDMVRGEPESVNNLSAFDSWEIFKEMERPPAVVRVELR